MYARSARFYDAIYASKDYVSEADEVDRRIQAAHPGAATLLDVACGTGGHLRALAGRYGCEGLDLSADQLVVAAERLPDVPLHEVDMVSFQLDRRFDAITCLFSSIGYVATVERLGMAILAMSHHLEPGGVLIVEPWLEPHVWQDGHLSALFVDEPDIKIARLAIAATEGRLSVMEMEHLVATKDGGVEHFVERHALGLFTIDEHLAAFSAAGLEVHHESQGLIGRGLYTAIRPASG
jgi:SAM-dependent methyltransferase